MKELKFTPENLERHLGVGFVYAQGSRGIYTTRNRLPGKLYEVFRIKDAGYFILESVKSYAAPYRKALIRDYWENEGFDSPEEFEDELNRIYPSKGVLFVLHMLEVFIDDDLDDGEEATE